MKKKTIYQLNSLYRDPMRVTGYTYGKGEPAICIMGALRGNEIQQVYICSQLNKRLKTLEREGRIRPGKEILVVPTANPYSINVGKRFWPADNTDINRMFPGYNLGETTQRIADGVFDAIRHYSYGIHLCSFYMTGAFLPHIRMMYTGFENISLADGFGLPYTIVREPKPYDTTTLNYNWQIWETEAFSLYTSDTEQINPESARIGVEAILRFMNSVGIIDYESEKAQKTTIKWEKDMEILKSDCAGFLLPCVKVGEQVEKGELLAEIVDPYMGEVKKEVIATESGKIFFERNKPVVYANTVLFRIIK
ncbi:MAG: succinylglutamate desuccinylase/aspartoacylase family protein [Eubacterium sp.]|nr:succinylglutamate desuccinylase/aspartoacylase family protein [Eubacterium sp.]MDD7208746.1 succinylglutamate desuccinylase/aspartoacylase family protein [Lachnospiraceae bacterium]MDY5497773.1 succinylglutamate desuccinylase/aspartoacylase family protein [Anaerobutyricum sp.]